MSLEKILLLTGNAPEPPDPDALLLLAAQRASAQLRELLVALDADDGPDDDGDDQGKDGGDHKDHPSYKALIKRGVSPAKAAAMCARADKKVKVTQLAASLEAMLSGDDLALATPASETAAGRREAAGEGDALDDGSYPIKSKRQLHSAAVLAASHHGNWQAAQRLIRRKARDFGVDVNSLPGFGAGGSEADGEKAAASMVALAAKMNPAVAMHHGPFTGRHSHPHVQTGVHEHEHEHYGDNNHSGGPLHRPGSEPRRYDY